MEWSARGVWRCSGGRGGIWVAWFCRFDSNGEISIRFVSFESGFAFVIVDGCVIVSHCRGDVTWPGKMVHVHRDLGTVYVWVLELWLGKMKATRSCFRVSRVLTRVGVVWVCFGF
jgi:hypothetical protein